MITLDGRAFEHFLRQRRNDLRRIVRQSLDRIEMCEVESEAWLAALALSDRRNRALDFLDAADQDTLLGRLYAKLVKWTGVSVRYALQLDHGSSDDEDHRPALASLLRAPHDTDPQIRHILREERMEFLKVVRASYSQAAAYVLLLIRMEWELRDLASLLWIGVATLRASIARCAELSGVQPSRAMPVNFVRLPVFLLALGCALSAGAAGTDAKLSHEYDPKISASDISTDVQVLSSDAFAGRAPGTAGEQQTVNFLSAMLRQSGLQPGNGDSFFQTVPVISNTLDVAHSSMSVVTARATQVLKVGTDVVYSNTTRRIGTAIKDSPLVFVGYGINAPEQGWDDYAGVDVAGKTAVILIGLPGGSTGAPFLTGTPGVSYYSRSSYKFEEAARHGAAAALIVHDARESGMEWDYIKSRYGGAQFQLRHEDDPEPDPPIVGWLSAGAAKSLFAAAGMSLRDVRDAAEKRGFKAMPLGDAKLEATIRSSVVAGESRNVIAKLPGAKYPDEAIVYSAHWDHFGTRPGMRGDNIFHGAIDNAMGVAGVLEIAAQFAAEDPKPDRSVIFFIPTLEEMGLLGSKYYTAHPVVPVANTVADINFDVLVPVGVTSNLVVTGLGKSGLDGWVKRAAQKQGRVVVGDPPGMTDSFFRSDHLSFARAGVPVLYIRGGDKSRDPGVDGLALWNAFGKRYHTPADKFDPSWDLRGIVQDMQLACGVGEALAASRDWPDWNEGTMFRAVRDRSSAGMVAARH